MRLLRCLTAGLLLSAAPAWAQTATGSPAAAVAIAGPEAAAAGTADGARTLAESLVPYVSQAAFAKNILTVAPDPAGYRITADFAPLLRMIAGTGANLLQVTPTSIVVSPRGDGDWNVFSDAPLSLKADIAQGDVRQTIDYAFTNPRFKGVYSTRLAAFLSGDGAIEAITSTNRDPLTESTAAVAGSTYTTTGSPGPDGSVNAAFEQTSDRLEQRVSFPNPDDPSGASRVDVSIKGGPIAVTSSIDAGRTRAMVDLYAFFLRHPEFAEPPATVLDKLGAAQNEMKTLIRAVLPLWNELKGRYDVGRMDVSSMFGSATIEKGHLDVSMGGVSTSTGFEYRLGYNGLSVQSPFVPAWTRPFIPVEMDIAFKVENADLKTPADILLAELDLSKETMVSDAVLQRAAATFTTTMPRFLMPASRVRAETYDVSMSGSLKVVNGQPDMTVDVLATGVDRTIEAMREAAKAEPAVNQAIGFLSIAKGFGKALPDGRTQWLVNLAPDGAVAVNSFQVKGPDVPQVPDDAADGTVPDDQNLDGGVSGDEPAQELAPGTP